MKISVIIPTYKPQNYLWKCLSSLMNQNLSKDDFEVVLILNGCCEPWNSMIKGYIDKEMKDINVNFIQVDHGGVSNARNIGLDCAKGEYITFIDDDDFVSPSYLKELLEKASPTAISLCYPLSFIDGTQEYVPYLITKDYKKNEGLNSCNYKRAKKFFSGPVYKLIHRDIIGDRRFDFHFHNGEDSIFMFLISDRFHDVTFTSKRAVYYRRIRINSAVSQKRKAKSIIVNMCKMIMSYCLIYFKDFGQYDFSFFATRVLGAIHGGIYNLRFIK